MIGSLFTLLKQTILIGIILSTAFAKEYESYFDRPDILKLPKQKQTTQLMKDWSELKRAHLEVTIMLSEMYKNHEIYFLARDSELLYDAAKIIFKNEPEKLKRLHLLNISRANMQALNVVDYLKQEGISKESLARGKKILFVDTGFSGTIPNTLKEYFPKELHANLQTHLLSSSNPNYPSSRMFLTAVNSEAPKLNPGNMHGSIITYEHMPRYTDRSTKFELKDGRWHPMSSKTVNDATDGKVSKKLATLYADDLKNYLESVEAKALISKRKILWQELLTLGRGNDQAALVAKLKAILVDPELAAFGEAVVRDFFDATKKNSVTPFINLDLSDVGLEEIKINRGNSNKIEMIKKHPEWKDILQNPSKGITKLLNSGDTATLGKIIDSVNDHEFLTILSSKVGEVDTPQNRLLIKTLIEKEKVNFLSVKTFTQASTEKMVDLYRLAILKAAEIGDNFALSSFALSTFAQPHTKEMYDLYKLVIQKAIEIDAQDVLNTFVYGAFSHPHTQEMSDLYQMVLKKVIQNRETSALRNFAETLELPHTKGPAFQAIQEILAGYDQNAPVDWKKMKELMNEKFKIKVVKIDKDLAKYDVIKLKKGTNLTIKEEVDTGKRGKVYRAVDKNGKSYAVKVAIDNEADTLKSFKQESSKNRLYKKYNIPHAKLIESTPRYMIKEWVEGERADQWMVSWEKSGFPAKGVPQIEALKEQIKQNAKAGVYIGDLNPKNLIWNGESWIVVDSGGVKEGLTQEETLNRYVEKISARWEKKLTKKTNCLQLILNKISFN